jgi:hypothetical protein
MKTVHKQNILAAALTCLCVLASSTMRAQDNPVGTPAPAPADASSSDASGAGDNQSAAKGGLSEEELAKIAQNPVANMISVPFQNNFNFDVGPNNTCQYVLNVQPVIPITLNENWNLITRWIMPIINQPSPAPGVRSAFGLGDINPSFFFSPANSGGLIWGVGPTTTLPTATDSMLGAGKWQVGPSAVALTIQGHWVLGALVNNQWSVGGWGPANQNNFLVQPFVNYNLPHGWYLTTGPAITANWNADHRNMWTVPVGGGIGKIIKLGGKLPVNLRLASYYNVCTPRYGSDWQLQFQIQFLLPKALFTKQ